MKVNNQEVYDKWKKEQQADGFPAIWILRAMEKFADAIENDIMIIMKWLIFQPKEK